MTRQYNKCTRCDIVRAYLENIEDDQIRIMCFLWTRGYSDDTVRRRLKITWPRLRELKAQIATDLLNAGIRLRG